MTPEDWIKLSYWLSEITLKEWNYAPSRIFDPFKGVNLDIGDYTTKGGKWFPINPRTLQWFLLGPPIYFPFSFFTDYS